MQQTKHTRTHGNHTAIRIPAVGGFEGGLLSGFAALGGAAVTGAAVDAADSSDPFPFSGFFSASFPALFAAFAASFAAFSGSGMSYVVSPVTVL
jgi:hypothetical protein